MRFRVVISLLAACAAAGVLFGPARLFAQAESSGAICVTAYHDADRNGAEAEGESIVSDVNVSLLTDSNIMLANYVTDGGEPYCFENLPAGEYVLSVDSPLYESTSPSAAVIRLESGQRVESRLGVVSRQPGGPGLYVPLSLPVRLLLSLGAALGAMVTVSGVGLLIYGLFLHRKTPQAGPSGPVSAMRIQSDASRRTRTAPGVDTFAHVSDTPPPKKSQLPIDDFEDESGDSFDDEFGRQERQ